MADKDYEKLVDKALENALEDRDLAKDAYEHMKDIFQIDKNNPETMQAVMLTGQQAVKLLESMSRSNEQILKLAQMKQKDKESDEDDDEDDKVIDIDDLRKAIGKG